MPSPKSLLTIYGLSTKWLDAPQAGLPVPRAIGEGEIVEVPGSLVFRAQRGGSANATRPFEARDSIKLHGHMSKIGRYAPDFYSPAEIHLQHPVQLTEFNYLKCIEAGKSTTVNGFVSISYNES